MRSALRRRLLLALCLALLPPSVCADPQVMEVITLGYRQADDVIPLLRPLLAPGGALTGASNQLIVRTTPANLAELKKVLAVMDSKPRQLMVSVRQSAAADVSRSAASLSGNVSAGANAQVTVPRPPGTQREPGVAVQSGSAQIEARGISSSATPEAGVTQTLRVLEGNSAFIRTGQTVPVAGTQVRGGGQVAQNTQFVEAASGFYVTPRVNGDRVTLEISTQRDRVRNPNTGTIDL
ncbi:MAG TPA: secretin N-terminal domain-containing protein, partial [Burkholderiales bacterium]|nr:secretin N-terminal domain-containing protein [Burkholderiales bacterium]